MRRERQRGEKYEIGGSDLGIDEEMFQGIEIISTGQVRKPITESKLVYEINIVCPR